MTHNNQPPTNPGRFRSDCSGFAGASTSHILPAFQHGFLWGCSFAIRWHTYETHADNRKNSEIQEFNAFPDQYSARNTREIQRFLFPAPLSAPPLSRCRPGRTGSHTCPSGFRLPGRPPGPPSPSQPSNLIPIYFSHGKVLLLKYYFFTGSTVPKRSSKRILLTAGHRCRCAVSEAAANDEIME